MDKNDYDKMLSNIWVAVGSGNMMDDLPDLAKLCTVDSAKFMELFPSREKIVLALIEDIWSKLNLTAKSEKLTPRDQIFDAVMMAFDIVAPYRTGLKKLTHALLMSPSTYIEIVPRLHKFGSDITDRYYSASGIMGAAVALTFNGVFATAYWTFLDDDTFDLSKTMASLDTSLKTASSLLSYCPGLEKI